MENIIKKISSSLYNNRNVVLVGESKQDRHDVCAAVLDMIANTYPDSMCVYVDVGSACSINELARLVAIKVHLPLTYSLSQIFCFMSNMDKVVYVAWDNFDRICSFDEPKVEALLRTIVQDNPCLGFIFSGEDILISEMFDNPSRPFYRSAEKVRTVK